LGSYKNGYLDMRGITRKGKDLQLRKSRQVFYKFLHRTNLSISNIKDVNLLDLFIQLLGPSQFTDLDTNIFDAFLVIEVPQLIEKLFVAVKLSFCLKHIRIIGYQADVLFTI